MNTWCEFLEPKCVFILTPRKVKDNQLWLNTELAVGMTRLTRWQPCCTRRDGSLHAFDAFFSRLSRI